VAPRWRGRRLAADERGIAAAQRRRRRARLALLPLVQTEGRDNPELTAPARRARGERASRCSARARRRAADRNRGARAAGSGGRAAAAWAAFARRASLDAAAVAARVGDARAELSWLRKLHALEPLARDGRARWLALEKQCGTPGGRLEALRALRDLTDDPTEQAELDAAEGAALAERGQLADASTADARALAGSRTPKLAWLRAQNELLARLGRATERVDLLRLLARHPEAALEERARHQRERIDLLASHPALREEAALELRMWIESDASAARTAPLERMRGLLALYEDLGRDAEWCALAERVHALVAEAERPELERRIAERLGARWG
jgi:hypothetical protein